MGYFVEKSGKTWRLAWRKGAEGRNVSKRSPEASINGFRPEMTLEEAKVHASKLQSRDKLQRQLELEARTSKRVAQQKLYRDAYFKELDVIEFERTLVKANKICASHWNTLQKIIVSINIHPSRWFLLKETVYQKFKECGYSPAYAKKLIRYLNIWGYYLCEKEAKAWKDLPGLNGVWINSLKTSRRYADGVSLPITPDMLALPSLLQPKHYNWIFLSVFFGLRPREVDNLKRFPNPKLNYFKDNCLWIFQEKLFERGVDEEKCWKCLPLEFPEQMHCREIIFSGNFKRPTRAIFLRVFGEGYSSYAGRKGFVTILKDRGISLEGARDRMGHQTVMTTERFYEVRRRR